MKKILFLITTIILLCSCTTQTTNPYEFVPEKNKPNGISIDDSSITTQNIDYYLFRDDVIYVDLRPYSWVAYDGYIAGFSFFPYYDFFAHHTLKDRLFYMEGSKGTVGSFIPNYVESEAVIASLFPKDKYIFAISQSGDECYYFFNLLLQCGYDVSKLYNIGGFANDAGFKHIAYKNLENPKYLVEGNRFIDTQSNVTLNFMKNLTPIED